MKAILLLVIISLFSCEDKGLKSFSHSLDDYAHEYPIHIENYNYTARFYIRNSDTILELGQDRIDVDYPIDFLFNQFDSVNSKMEKKFVRIGKILLRDDEFFIFDTRDSLGKNYYQGLSIVPVDDNMEEVTIFNYPYLPIAKIYSLQEGKLNFVEDRDTIRFK